MKPNASMNFEQIRPSNPIIALAPTRTLLALIAASLVFAFASDAEAKKPRYVYIVSKVASADDVKGVPAQELRRGLQKALDDSEEIIGALPEGTPDPKTAPKKFKRFLAKKKLTAFKVNVEVIAYDRTVETNERGYKRVGAHISIRLFGEHMPERVMAFAGAGSATVKLDVGKRVRPVDHKAADKEAIQVAVKDAVAASLKKLAEPKKKKKKRRRKK